MTFNIGDRVLVTENIEAANTEGKHATIKCFYNNLLGLEFNEPVKYLRSGITGGHTLRTNGAPNCEEGYGWFVSPDKCQLLPEFMVGDQVLFVGNRRAYVNDYTGVVEAVDEAAESVEVHFYATGTDPLYKEGWSFVSASYPFSDIERIKGSSVSTKSVVQKKIDYLWNKSKWGKAHPLTQ